MKKSARAKWELVHQVLADPEVRSVFIWGPWGNGKTYAAFNYGRLENGFSTVTMSEELTSTELRGHFILKGLEAIWHDGTFVDAMRFGKRLVINEISNANGDVKSFLYPILESIETAQITLPS